MNLLEIQSFANGCLLLSARQLRFTPEMLDMNGTEASKFFAEGVIWNEAILPAFVSDWEAAKWIFQNHEGSGRTVDLSELYARIGQLANS